MNLEAAERIAAKPVVQIGFIVFCAAWFALGFRVDLLTAALSILAITLSQMVLHGQHCREAIAHRRDLAMHAKLDELLYASAEARDDLAHIEDEAEDIIQEKRL